MWGSVHVDTMESVDVLSHISYHVCQFVQMILWIEYWQVLFKLNHSAMVFVGYNQQGRRLQNTQIIVFNFRLLEEMNFMLGGVLIIVSV